MKRPLPLWCRKAKHAMIDKDMGPKDLAEELGFSRPYVTAIINGRVYAESAVKRISFFLGIDCDYFAADDAEDASPSR